MNLLVKNAKRGLTVVVVLIALLGFGGTAVGAASLSSSVEVSTAQVMIAQQSPEDVKNESMSKIKTGVIIAIIALVVIAVIIALFTYYKKKRENEAFAAADEYDDDQNSELDTPPGSGQAPPTTPPAI